MAGDNNVNMLINIKAHEESKRRLIEEIKQIEDKINKNPIEIKFKVDKQVLNILNSFNDNIKKFGNEIDGVNNKLKKQVKIVQDENGEWVKRTRIFDDDGIKEYYGKITEKQKESLNNTNKEADAIKEVNKETKTYNNLIDEQIRKKKTLYDKEGTPVRVQTTTGTDINQNVYTTTATGTTREEIDNIQKGRDLQLKAQKEIEAAFIATEQKRRQEYEKSEKAQAKMTNKNLENNYKAIEGFKNSSVESLDRLKARWETVMPRSELLKQLDILKVKILEIDSASKKIGTEELRKYKQEISSLTNELNKTGKEIEKTQTKGLSFGKQLGIALISRAS